MLDALKLQIANAVNLWNFDLATTLFLNNLENFDTLKYDYLIFLYETGKISQALELINKFEKDLTNDTARKDEILELKEKILTFLENPHFGILSQESYACFLLNSMINQNNAEVSKTYEIFRNHIWCGQNKTSQAYFCQSSIDYFLTREDSIREDFFMPVNFEDIRNYFLSMLQNLSYTTQGGGIYYKKFSSELSRLLRFNIQFLPEVRVAVCFHGIFRGNYKGNLSNLIKKLEKEFRVDCFVYTWNKYHLWPGFSGGISWVVRLLKKDLQNLAPEEIRYNEQIVKYFPNTSKKLKKEYFKPLKNKNMTDLQLPQIKAFDLDDLNTNLSNPEKMYHGIYKSFELMSSYENKMGFKYDFVIFLRPDIILRGDLTLDDLRKLKPNEVAEVHEIWGTGTGFPYGRRESMEIYASMWKHYNVLKSKIADANNNHSMFLKWANINQLEVVKYSFEYDLYNGLSKSGDLPCLLGLKIPNITKELGKDIENLRKNNSLTAEKIESCLEFFKTLMKSYDIIKSSNNFLRKIFNFFKKIAKKINK